jgi:hypothetical protein
MWRAGGAIWPRSSVRAAEAACVGSVPDRRGALQYRALLASMRISGSLVAGAGYLLIYQMCA